MATTMHGQSGIHGFAVQQESMVETMTELLTDALHGLSDIDRMSEYEGNVTLPVNGDK